MPDDYTSDTQTTGAVAVGAWVDAKPRECKRCRLVAVDLVAGKTYSFVQAPTIPWIGGTISDPRSWGSTTPLAIPSLPKSIRIGETIVHLRACTSVPMRTGSTSSPPGALIPAMGTPMAVTKSSSRRFRTISAIFHFHAGAGSIEVGTPVAAMIDYGADTDWFAVELDVGDTYRFDLRGKSTGHGTLKYPVIGGLYDDAGVRISPSVDEGGTGRNARFPLRCSGQRHLLRFRGQRLAPQKWRQRLLRTLPWSTSPTISRRGTGRAARCRSAAL